MAAKQKSWEELYQQSGANQAQGVPETDVGTMNKVDVGALSKPSTQATGGMVDPSRITQSFYTTPTNYGNYETGRPVYSQSEAVQNAANKLQQQQAAKPGEYQSQYGDRIQELIDQALNRPAFHYDFAADPMFQQYAQQYQRGGQLAMENAMAQSAALTGGYGNSYAQQLGQQTYQGFMEGLYNQLPELRNAAYQMYQDEGNTLRQNLAMLQGQDETDYGRYRDTVTDWRSDVDMLYNMYSDMSEAEYNRYINDAAAWEADREYWYRKAYDEQQQRNWEAEFNARYGGGSSGGGSSGGGGKKKKKSEPVFVDDHGIAASNTVTDVLAEYMKKKGML